MKAIVQPRYGSPDTLELRDVPLPEVRDGDVLVRVHASSVNAADVECLHGTAMVRFGSPLRPRHRIVGSDIAGTVERVGAKVTDWEPGDEVYADLTEEGFGAFAEFVAVPGEALTAKPSSLAFHEAGVVPSAACVAIQGIRDHRLPGPGSRVLVNGAGGGMGTFAVQMARSFGAEVTGVDSAPKLELIRSLGAEHVIDYRAEDYTKTGQQYDLILDVQAHRSVRASRRALAPDGAYLMVGGSTRRIIEGIALGTLMTSTSDQKLGLLLGWPNRRRDIDQVSELIESEAVRPVVDHVYPLEDAAEAMRRVEAGDVMGKVAISIIAP